MLVYLTAFALSLPFLGAARANFCKWKGIAPQTGGAACAALSREQKLEYKLRYILFFLLAFLPPFFISAVRYGIGTDYFYTYVPEWNKLLTGEGNGFSEWGFNAIILLLQLFTDDPQWLFVVTSAVYFYFIYRTVIRYSENAYVSAAVLFVSCFYFWSLNNVRQGIAVTALFAAYPYLVRRETWKYLLCVLVGFLFHKTAIIMIVPYVAVNLRFVRREFPVWLVIAVIALPFACVVLEFILRHTKYEYFFTSDLNDNQSTTLNIFYHLVFFVLMYLALGRSYKADKQAYVLLFLQFFAFYISCVSLFIPISEMISRATMYFQVYQILSVPYCLKRIRRADNRAAFALIYFGAYALYLIWFIVLKGYHDVLPYQWIFSQ